MKSVKLNVFLQIFYQILAIIVPFVTTPFVSRIFGTDGIGEYTFSYTIILYFSIFSLLGTSTLGTRTIASCLDNKEKRDKEFWNIYYFQFFISTIVIIIYYLYLFAFKLYSNLNIVMGLYLVGCLFDINWYFFGTEKFVVTVIKNTIVKIVTFVLIFVLIKTKNDIWLYAVIITGSFVVSNVVLWINLFKEVKFYLPCFNGIKTHIKENIILFLPTIAASIFAYADKIMLGVFFDKSEVGVYESMEKILNIPIAFSTAIDTVIFSRNVKLFAIKDYVTMKNTISKFMSFIIVFTIGASFGIAAISDQFVPLYFGDGFEKVILLLKIGGIYLFFRVVRSSLKSQILLPSHKDKLYIIILFGAGILNFIINLLLIPNYGAFGATIATISSEMILITVCLYFSRDFIDFKKLFFNFFVLIIFGFIMFTSIVIIRQKLALNIYFMILIEIFIGIAIYIGLYVLFIIILKLIRRKENEKNRC